MSKGKRAVYIVVDLVVMAVLVFIDRYTKELEIGRDTSELQSR